MKDEILKEIKKTSEKMTSVALKPIITESEYRRAFNEMCFLAGHLAGVLSKLEEINEKEKD